MIIQLIKEPCFFFLFDVESVRETPMASVNLSEIIISAAKRIYQKDVGEPATLGCAVMGHYWQHIERQTDTLEGRLAGRKDGRYNCTVRLPISRAVDAEPVPPSLHMIYSSHIPGCSSRRSIFQSHQIIQRVGRVGRFWSDPALIFEFLGPGRSVNSFAPVLAKIGHKYLNPNSP